MKAHLIGGGLASLAAATGFLANNVTIYEADDCIGGAMSMLGGPETGYILPTGRVFEKEFRCTLELFSLVPSTSDPQKSIRDEIIEFNERFGYYDKAHIVDRNGTIVKSSHFGLNPRHILALIKLALTPESMLEGKRINEFLSEDLFQTEFWFLWAPLMGSLPQHSAMEMRRYINRFLHLLPDLSTMTKIYRTRYNQYEAIIKPTLSWLERQGVKFLTGALVTSIEFKPSRENITVNSLNYVQNGKMKSVEIDPNDIVLVTNGSQIADLSVGSVSEPATVQLEGRSWALWHRLAQGRGEFGRPEVFFGKKNVGDTKWVTLTVTTTDPEFFELMSAFTASEPGRGGLITFKDSNWLLTLAIFHQPEFIDQPEGVMVWWGYGMYPDIVGNFIKKPMSECSGSEILEEVLRHLRFDNHLSKLLDSSKSLPCTLPYAGSVWMPRRLDDRPKAVPDGSTNFGFIGQFAEIPLETIFTMEYSVRTARVAVSTLLKLKAALPPVYQGQHDIDALRGALETLI